MLGGPPRRRPEPQSSFESLEASLLHCPRCRQAMPVRKRLLLVLLDGEKHEYVCQRCGTPCASKIEPLPRVMG
jgi:DNA-directed RNA polymerase subunit RPC12/RpoP